MFFISGNVRDITHKPKDFGCATENKTIGSPKIRLKKRLFCLFFHQVPMHPRRFNFALVTHDAAIVIALDCPKRRRGGVVGNDHKSMCAVTGAFIANEVAC